MKGENAYNAFLSKELKKFSPEIFHTKVADRFRVGVSDFLLWGLGASAAVEVKFIAKAPSPGAQLLKHPFVGPQRAFLRAMTAAGSLGWGLVVIGDRGAVYTVDSRHIPENGNWVTSEFLCNPTLNVRSFGIKETRRLAFHLLTKESDL